MTWRITLAIPIVTYSTEGIHAYLHLPDQNNVHFEEIHARFPSPVVTRWHPANQNP